MKDSYIGFRVPSDLHQWFRDFADREGKSMTDLVVERITELQVKERLRELDKLRELKR